jgi:hypothetical protein
MAARFLATAAAVLLLSGSIGWAQTADPPGRVGRLSLIEGTVQQRSADDNDWTQAGLNYPVTSGFAIATQEDGRAELQVGSMALRLGPTSELDVNTLNDREATLTLAQGELNVQLGRVATGERIEIVTPRGVVDLLAAGQYHIDAGTTDSPTRFEVFSGRAQLQYEGGNQTLGNGQAALIDAGGALSMAQAQPDELDQWAFGRDRGPGTQQRGTQQRAAAGYAPPEMTGAADLDVYGNWQTDPQYGSVWYPSDVPQDWAPYSYGHWGWVSPWGWTWIDDQPWGFAPFHYGRWAYTGIGWGWIPGEYVETPVYAPALVVFFGGGGSAFYYDGYREGIGWCPLGPGELYVPGYGVSVNYVRNVNITNVSINRFDIARVNNTIVVNHDPHWGGQASNFANHRFATVVPANSFAQARDVHQVAVRPSRTTDIARLPVAHTPPVAAPPHAARTAGAPSGTQFNRSSGPSISQGRTGPTAGRPTQPGTPSRPQGRFAAGRNLPPVPPAHSGATAGNRALGTPPGNAGPNSLQTARPGPGPVSPTPRNAPATVAGRNLPALPPAHGGPSAGNRPQGNGGPAAQATPGPRGFRGPNAPNATANSAGQGLRNPSSRQQWGRTPSPPPRQQASPPSLPAGVPNVGRQPQHVQQNATPPAAPTRNAAAPHGAPSPRSFDRNAAPPTHTAPPRPNLSAAAPQHVSPPPRNVQRNVAPQTHAAAPAQHFQPQAQSFQRNPAQQAHAAPPVQHFQAPPQAPQRNAAAPAAPSHAAPPAAPARPSANVSHGALAPPAQAAPHPQGNQKRNNNGS